MSARSAARQWANEACPSRFFPEIRGNHEVAMKRLTTDCVAGHRSRRRRAQFRGRSLLDGSARLAEARERQWEKAGEADRLRGRAVRRDERAAVAGGNAQRSLRRYSSGAADAGRTDGCAPPGQAGPSAEASSSTVPARIAHALAKIAIAPGRNAMASGAGAGAAHGVANTPVAGAAASGEGAAASRGDAGAPRPGAGAGGWDADAMRAVAGARFAVAVARHRLCRVSPRHRPLVARWALSSLLKNYRYPF